MTVIADRNLEADFSAPQELPPEQVIAWLRSDEGERWALTWLHRIIRHGSDSGLFGCVLEQPEAYRHQARWPEPFHAARLFPADWPPPAGRS